MSYKKDGDTYSSYQEYQMICKIDKEMERKKKKEERGK